MLKECFAEAVSLLAEAVLGKPAPARAEEKISRGQFLKTLGGLLAGIGLAAAGVKTAEAGCPYQECTSWSCSPCPHMCGGSNWSMKRECVRWCRDRDPCYGYTGPWYTQTQCNWC